MLCCIYLVLRMRDWEMNFLDTGGVTSNSLEWESLRARTARLMSVAVEGNGIIEPWEKSCMKQSLA